MGFHTYFHTSGSPDVWKHMFPYIRKHNREGKLKTGSFNVRRFERQTRQPGFQDGAIGRNGLAVLSGVPPAWTQATQADHRVWQDVYKPSVGGGRSA
jgi:hypothetical protein